MIATGVSKVIHATSCVCQRPVALYGFAHFSSHVGISELKFRTGGATGDVLWHVVLNTTNQTHETLQFAFPQGLVFPLGMFVEVLGENTPVTSILYSL